MSTAAKRNPEPTPEQADRRGLPAGYTALPGLIESADKRGLTLLGQRLRTLRTIFCELPGQLTQASPAQSCDLLQQVRADLDYFLYTPAAESLQAAFEQCVALDPQRWVDGRHTFAAYVDGLRQEAIAHLTRLGVRRVNIVAGWPFRPDLVVPSDEAPLPTANPDWDGRVATVRPGQGAWQFGDQVIGVAVARRYEYRAA